MIWLRRFLAIILGLLLLPIFLVILIVTQVNDTVGNPQFYITQLKQGDVYNFLYDDLLPSALDEVNQEVDTGEFHLDISKIKWPLLATMRQALPPEWLQVQVEHTLSQVLPYALGDRDTFVLTIPFKDRVEATSEAVKSNLLTQEAFRNLYDPTVDYAVDQTLANLDMFPYRITLSQEEVDSSLRTLVPQEWLLTQAKAVLDVVIPYLTKDSEHFTIRVPLQDRVEAARAVIIRLLGRQETYDFLMDSIVGPVIEQNVAQLVSFPFGVTLTQEEVLSGVKEVLPQPWVNERLEDLVNRAALYLEGRSNSLEIMVPLAERKAAALEVLSNLADRKLLAFYNGLPQCSSQDLLQGVVANGAPKCRLAGMSYEEAKKALGIDTIATVIQVIGNSIPDQWTFSQGELRRAIGEENWSNLEKARDWVINGWTYTDSDLRRDLGEENTAHLEDIREWIASGYTFDQQDLRERIREANIQGQGDPLMEMDNARHWLGLARRLLLLVWIIPGLLLVIISLLGGRSWPSKLAWGAGALLVIAAIFFAAFGPVYRSLARPELQRVLAQGIERIEASEATARIALDKASSIALNPVDTFASGIQIKALIAIAVALGALAVAVVAMVRSRGRSKLKEKE